MNKSQLVLFCITSCFIMTDSHQPSDKNRQDISRLTWIGMRSMTLTQKWTRSNSIVIPHVAPRQGSKPLNTNQRQSKDQIISEYPYIYLRPTLNSSSRILTFTFTKTSSKIYQSQFLKSNIQRFLKLIILCIINLLHPLDQMIESSRPHPLLLAVHQGPHFSSNTFCLIQLA